MRSIEEIINRQMNRWDSISQTLKYHPGESGHPDDLSKEHAHPVICISRDIGAGGRIVMEQVCTRLNYGIFGSSLIDEIAQDLNVQRRIVDDLDENARTGLDMMLKSFLQGREIEAEEYFHSLVRVIKTLALRGGVVLLGRGACFIVGQAAALNIQITADKKMRIQRVMEYERVTKLEAARIVEQSDLRRGAFAKKYFKIDLHDSRCFDLCLNTSRMSPMDAADLVMATLEARGFDLEQMKIHPTHPAAPC